MSDEERLVRTAEAARIAQVHPQTLREWEARGLIKSVRQEGTYRRWRVADLKALAGGGDRA